MPTPPTAKQGRAASVVGQRRVGGGVCKASPQGKSDWCRESRGRDSVRLQKVEEAGANDGYARQPTAKDPAKAKRIAQQVVSYYREVGLRHDMGRAEAAVLSAKSIAQEKRIPFFSDQVLLDQREKERVRSCSRIRLPTRSFRETRLATTLYSFGRTGGGSGESKRRGHLLRFSGLGVGRRKGKKDEGG